MLGRKCEHGAVADVNTELWLGAQIRQQEIAARRAVAKNPVKMDAIKREVAMAKAQQVRPSAGCLALRRQCLCLACSAALACLPVLQTCLLLRMHQHNAARELCISCSCVSMLLSWQARLQAVHVFSYAARLRLSTYCRWCRCCHALLGLGPVHG